MPVFLFVFNLLSCSYFVCSRSIKMLHIWIEDGIFKTTQTLVFWIFQCSFNDYLQTLAPKTNWYVHCVNGAYVLHKYITLFQSPATRPKVNQINIRNLNSHSHLFYNFYFDKQENVNHFNISNPKVQYELFPAFGFIVQTTIPSSPLFIGVYNNIHFWNFSDNGKQT